MFPCLLFFSKLCVRWERFNNSSCSEDRHVKFCPCQGTLRYSMKLSRINAISGDIVCTQQRDTQVVKKKKSGPSQWCKGWGGVAGRCEGPASFSWRLRVEQARLLQPQIPQVAQDANKRGKPGMFFNCFFKEQNSSVRARGGRRWFRDPGIMHPNICADIFSALSAQTNIYTRTLFLKMVNLL